MLEIKFNMDGEDRHQCYGVKDGEWIIYKCPSCSYIRKVNTTTGKSTSQGGDWTTLHEGSLIELDDSPKFSHSDN